MMKMKTADLLRDAQTARDELGLKYAPSVIRDEGIARRIAANRRAGCVMLGPCDDEGGVYWVVCLADAERLARAGYEYAPC